MKAIFAVVIGILSASALTAPVAAAPTPVQVQVTNTPLPVSVTNASTNQSVTVTNSSLPVQVANTTPISVSSTEEPFQSSLTGQSFAANFTTALLFTVPSGKRLVIEHVSLTLNLFGANGIAQAQISTQNAVGTLGAQDAIDCHQNGSDAQNHWFACSEMTKVYANAGETVNFQMQTVDSVGGEWAILVSGHYVPAP